MDVRPKARPGLKVRALEGLTPALQAAIKGIPSAKNATTPMSWVGKSGVKHGFTFGYPGDHGPDMVCDVILSEVPIDETDVLAFFIRVYDVGAKSSILCTSPGLTPGALRLALLYKIRVIQCDGEEDAGSKLAEELSMASQ